MAGLAKLRCGILPFVEGPLWAVHEDGPLIQISTLSAIT